MLKEEELVGLTLTPSGIQGAVREKGNVLNENVECRNAKCVFVCCCFFLLVSDDRSLQERLHPRTSLQGETRTLYKVLQLRLESTHMGEVSLHITMRLEGSVACTSYSSAPRTGVHKIIKDSQELSDTETFSGQHGTIGRMETNRKMSCAKLCCFGWYMDWSLDFYSTYRMSDLGHVLEDWLRLGC